METPREINAAQLLNMLNGTPVCVSCCDREATTKDADGEKVCQECADFLARR